MAIDYGLKRTGLAVTDPMQILATPLTTIESARLFTFLAAYFEKEQVERLLIGDPHNLDGSPTHITADVQRIIGILHRKFPLLPVEPVDEQYSSVMAARELHALGMKKQRREEKGMIDQMAAALILRDYLAQKDDL